MSGVTLYVGGQPWSVQGERDDLGGQRCFTAVGPVQTAWEPDAAAGADVLLDSGAFSDAPEDRLTPAQALTRQLHWEQRAAERWQVPGWHCTTLASYDQLIDEKWTPAGREKHRWTEAEAVPAIRTTVAGARYLASQRANLAPRTLVLGLQGVTPRQYAQCATEVLAYATPGDWIGLGGWCILGRWTSWVPAFFDAMARTLPLIVQAGVRHIHLFGVLYLPALGGLLWLADQAGVTVSTDSSAPLLSCTRGNGRKAGVRAPYWRDNIEVWRQALARLSESTYYRPPAWQGVML